MIQLLDFSGTLIDTVHGAQALMESYYVQTLVNSKRAENSS